MAAILDFSPKNVICNMFVLNKTCLVFCSQKYKSAHQKFISNVIKIEDNAENKIHQVISQPF